MPPRCAGCPRRWHRNREASETRFAQTADASLSDFGTSDVASSTGTHGNGHFKGNDNGNGNAYGKFAKAEVEIVSSTDASFRAVSNADKDGVFTLKKVPAGGIEVTVRRKGDVLGRGAAVLDGQQKSYTIEIVAPSLVETKP